MDDKVRHLRGQNRGNGDEADDEADNEDAGAAELRELLKEKEDFDRLKVSQASYPIIRRADIHMSL